MALPFRCECGNAQKEVVCLKARNKLLGDYSRVVSICTKCGKEDVR